MDRQGDPKLKPLDCKTIYRCKNKKLILTWKWNATAVLFVVLPTG